MSFRDDGKDLAAWVKSVERRLGTMERGGLRGPGSSFGLPFQVGNYRFFEHNGELCVQNLVTFEIQCIGDNGGCLLRADRYFNPGVYDISIPAGTQVIEFYLLAGGGGGGGGARPDAGEAASGGGGGGNGCCTYSKLTIEQVMAITGGGPITAQVGAGGAGGTGAVGVSTPGIAGSDGEISLIQFVLGIEGGGYLTAMRGAGGGPGIINGDADGGLACSGTLEYTGFGGNMDWHKAGVRTGGNSFASSDALAGGTQADKGFCSGGGGGGSATKTTDDIVAGGAGEPGVTEYYMVGNGLGGGGGFTGTSVPTTGGKGCGGGGGGAGTAAGIAGQNGAAGGAGEIVIIYYGGCSQGIGAFGDLGGNIGGGGSGDGTGGAGGTGGGGGGGGTGGGGGGGTPALLAGMTRTFLDDFEAPSGNWSRDNYPSNRNSELQLWRDDSTHVDYVIEEGRTCVQLAAIDNGLPGYSYDGSNGGAAGDYQYTAGTLESIGWESSTVWPVGATRKAFRVIAKYPTGVGFWMGAWLLAYPGFGQEIDIMEDPNLTPGEATTNYHWDGGGGPLSQQDGPVGFTVDVTQFHDYIVIVSTTAIIWYIDGVEIRRNTDALALSELNGKDLMMILQVAIGGTFPGPPDGTTPFPSYAFVDRVEVWTD